LDALQQLQAYSGPSCHRAKVATIPQEHLFQNCIPGCSVRAAESFEVLPDDHTIWVGFRDDFLISEHSVQEITFMAKAGQPTYEVYGESRRRTWHCWVEDMVLRRNRQKEYFNERCT
jgi:hypothetical protein